MTFLGVTQPRHYTMGALMRTATFPIELAGAVTRRVAVRWTTQPLPADPEAGYAETIEGQDFVPASGAITMSGGPGEVTNIMVQVRDDDPERRRSRFQVVLTAQNGALLQRGVATAELQGWVGILDRIGVVDGPVTPFVPGLIGVMD